MLFGSASSATRALGLPMLCLLASLAWAEAARAEKTVKVFVLAGQSNMEGKASNALLESQAADPRFKDFWGDYRTGDAWTERDDVFVTFFNRHGPLTIGYGSPNATGPELAFGRILGDHCKDPVLLIKTAWGGHSLYKNFRPPSAGLPSEQELAAELAAVQKKQPAATLDEIKAGYGDSYRKMLAEVKRVLDEKDTLFPALAGCTPEMAGFFWFQGFNDQFGDAAPAEYEANMKHLIADVRKDLNAPKMPVVIAGNTAYVSGQVTVWNGEFKFIGKVGQEFSTEQAAQAARLCGLNIIAQLKLALGDLDRVKSICKLGVFVNCLDSFTEQPKVANGVSDMMVEVFGEAGKHARSAVGVNTLPLNVAVEVDAIIEIA